MNQTYINESKSAFDESIKLGLSPRIEFNELPHDFIDQAKGFCDTQLLPFLAAKHPNDYWGEQCLNLVAQTFAILQYQNIDCEIVMGEVIINGTPEFDTTLSGLKEEFDRGISDQPFCIHVWVQIGENFIIDPSICARLKKYYIPSFPVPSIVKGKSDELLEELRLDYKPMLVGAKYLTKTCGIPLSYSEQSIA
ncbi:hypothetical protein [Shewanella indica]|uniref:hypothetical protein n=1 Tax=Shewanella indica TaxID=768528 RepID=UPI001F3DB48F|nr:hypothetical protein [Shewanella indica]